MYYGLLLDILLEPILKPGSVHSSHIVIWYDKKSIKMVMINLVPRVESVLTPRIYLRSQISSLRVKKVTISKTNDIFYYKKDTLLAPTD